MSRSRISQLKLDIEKLGRREIKMLRRLDKMQRNIVELRNLRVLLQATVDKKSREMTEGQ